MLKMIDTISRTWSFPLAIASVLVSVLGVTLNFFLPSDNPRVIIFTAILVGILVIIILIIVACKAIMRGRVVVPNIKDLTIAEARGKLESSGLLFSPYMKESPDTKILTQNPEVNEFVKKGSIVEIETEAHQLKKVSQEVGRNYPLKSLAVVKLDNNGNFLNGKHNDIDYEEQGIYSGHYSNGVPNGKGVHKTDKFAYDGDFVNGIPSGRGVITWADGEKYVGDFLTGRRHGKATYTYANGDVYDGDFKGSKMHGKGTYTWASGSVYDGDFKDDNRHGTGTYTLAGGDKYIGGWLNDNMHGEGTYTWASGNEYTGGWLDDKRHGSGTFKFGDKSEFAGDWTVCNYVNNARNGGGTYYRKNGRYDKGTWKDSKKHGTFLCYDDNDQLLREEKYIDGKLQ